MSDVNKATKEFIDEVSNAISKVGYITEHAEELGPLEVVMFGTAVLDFGSKIDPIFRELKKRNGETSTTIIKFEK